MKTYYVTKYALSKGIYELAVQESKIVDISGHNEINDHGCWLRLDKDCFVTRDEAEADARNRAAKRLNQLRKQEEKLEKLAKTPKWAKS